MLVVLATTVMLFLLWTGLRRESLSFRIVPEEIVMLNVTMAQLNTIVPSVGMDRLKLKLTVVALIYSTAVMTIEGYI